MRLGVVIKVIPEKKIGFIRTQDFVEDVFFHFSVVDKAGQKFNEFMEGDQVEYEVDELQRIEGESRLKATLVRPTRRPIEKRINFGQDVKNRIQHHPKARQRRPTWRNKPGRDDAEE